MVLSSIRNENWGYLDDDLIYYLPTQDDLIALCEKYPQRLSALLPYDIKTTYDLMGKCVDHFNNRYYGRLNDDFCRLMIRNVLELITMGHKTTPMKLSKFGLCVKFMINNEVRTSKDYNVEPGSIIDELLS